MSHDKKLLVAELKSPHEEISLDLFTTSLQSHIEKTYGSDLKATLKWVYSPQSSQFFVLIDNENVVSDILSGICVELKLKSEGGESVVFTMKLITNSVSLPVEFLIVSADKSNPSLDLPYEIQEHLSTQLSLPFTSISLYSRCGDVM